ncbi:pyridoxal phosphate-dependent decarboxylase family protein [Thalassospira mesophila]|uniref:pyridoxal phosphate-dependent decarboxylase family protein n=1 Tax=Thalassospira mesophila TaxID=1293891 RepID=UPI000A1EB93E|nr:pyridoxal-dependent decarboxylase [Thalassospira mesophila]
MLAMHSIDDNDALKTIDTLKVEDPKTIELSEVFSVEEFLQVVEVALGSLSIYLADDTLRGLALTEPQHIMHEARQLMTSDLGEPHSAARQEKLKAILELYIKTGIQVHSPGYMGRQFSGVIPMAGIVDLVNSIINQPSSFYEAAQLPSVAERIMANELNRFIGYPDDNFALVTTSGASLANLTALLTARNSRYPQFWAEGAPVTKNQERPAIAVSGDSHYSVSRAAGIMGIGEAQLVKLPIDGKGCIDLSKVGATLDAAKARGLDVFCLVATSGTTSVCAFDPIEELAEVCQKRNIWLHVDAAHGGSLLLSEQRKHKLKGIEKADSFAWDAHKMLFMPAMCTLLFYKEGNKRRLAFNQEASYVFEKEDDIYTEYDSAQGNFECTKRPLIMNLWVCWVMYGKALFEKKIDLLCELTDSAYHFLEQQPDFTALHRPEANILCFRYCPSQVTDAELSDFQLRLRNDIKAAGKFFISKVNIDGITALRVVFMNHETTLVHFSMLLDELRQTATQWREDRNVAMRTQYNIKNGANEAEQI